MDAVTPKDATKHATHVRPAPWNGGRRAFRVARSRRSCSTPRAGLSPCSRALRRARCCRHEHVKIEQTYVLEGRLVDQDGPRRWPLGRPREFVWRPAGSRHSAYAPEGGVMLAMFQLPNKFFERDGRVTDANGEGLGERVGAGVQGVAGAGDAAQEIIYPCLVVYASFPVCGRGETVDARDLKTDFLYLRRPARIA